MRQANILDVVHDELPPNVWDDPASAKPTLKPVHAHWITNHIFTVLDKHGYSHPEKWLKLVLTGSLTTYQYGPESDVDISLFINSSVFPEWSRAEMVGIMIEHGDGVILPGTSYPMQCYVVPHSITPADLYKPGLRSGYDIHSHHWIEPPDRGRAHNVEQQENGFYVYALEQADKMERLLRYEPDKAVKFWHQIHQRRARDQQVGKGDFSESNIIYKFLANRGLFPSIADVSGEHIAAQTGWTDFYHVSPTRNRESIQNLGLMGENGTSPWGDPWKRGQPYGNYMFTNPQDAHEYAYALHGQESPDDLHVDDEDERWEYPKAPEDMHEWPDEQQDEWYENNQPVERTEDPGGYDVWKVDTRGLPIHRDPENALGTNYRRPDWTPQKLRQEYERRVPGGEWDDQLIEHTINQGGSPARFYTPENIDPQRLQMHQHYPRWDVTDAQFEGHDPSLEIPYSWDQMQLRRPQFPSHAKVAETIPAVEPIRPQELSSPTAIERGHSRPVTPEEWQRVAEEGRQRYEAMATNADGTEGLDAQWPWLKEHGWNSVQQPWGGATINAATGAPVEGNADLYALTAKPPGTETLSIPINASREHFMSAMDEARRRYADLLERANHHLGIFRDEDLKRIDFDPVLTTDNLQDAESIGAHTRNIGGAYHFASGDGFWPPHVPDQNQVQSAAGPGPWSSYAEFRSANRTEIPPEWWPEGSPNGLSQE